MVDDGANEVGEEDLILKDSTGFGMAAGEDAEDFPGIVVWGWHCRQVACWLDRHEVCRILWTGSMEPRVGAGAASTIPVTTLTEQRTYPGQAEYDGRRNFL